MAIESLEGFDQSHTIKQHIDPINLKAKIAKKSFPIKALLSGIPLAEVSTSPQVKKMAGKSKPVDEEFSKELDQILEREEKGINLGIWQLENTEPGKEALETGEELKEVLLTYAELSHAAVEGGLELLEGILPEELLDNEILHIHLEVLGDITVIAGVFLNALDVGANGLAVICQDRLVSNAYELLYQLQEQYLVLVTTEKSPSNQDIKQATPEQLKQIHKTLMDWEAKLNVMKNALSENKIKLGLSGSEMAVGLTNALFQAIPWKMSLSSFKIVGTSLSFAVTGFSLLTEAVELKENIENAQVVTQWSKAFKEWQDRYHLIPKSQNLLEKRQRVAKEKIKQLIPDIKTLEPEIKTLKEKQFGDLKKNEFKEEEFQRWYSAHSQEDLLHTYVDHHETLELVTKNALREVISVKHTVEKRLLNFKMGASSINFSVATIAFMISGAIAVAGLLTLPLGGVGFILLGISAGPVAISAILGLTGLWLSYRAKPATFVAGFIRGMNTKILWAKLQVSIRNYFIHAKEKKLIEIAKILQQLKLSKPDRSDPQYLAAFNAFKKAKADFEESKKKIEDWETRLGKLNNIMLEKAWQDFEAQAGLNSEIFNTLQAFNEAIQQCDLRLFSEETKTLLEVQLGINMDNLQEQIKKDPLTLQKILMEFSALKDTFLIDFIRTQNERMKFNSIPTPSAKL